mmetsp:Transcript_52417/g.151043  ORF Transcript_52417/g.151043 Transcript_52417/m.151043 type:complete len:210 (-) Transcript_52417:153-782(-)
MTTLPAVAAFRPWAAALLLKSALPPCGLRVGRFSGLPLASARQQSSSSRGATGVGRPQMVDVSSKAHTVRRARAACRVIVGEEVAKALAAGTVAKGDVFTVSEVAGIMAAKRTPDFLPLCHPLPLTKAIVECRLDQTGGIVEVVAEVHCTGQTGVEMESLTAAATASLCIYDMCKPISKGIVITDLRLLTKSGGKSGDYNRYEEEQGVA